MRFLLASFVALALSVGSAEASDRYKSGFELGSFAANGSITNGMMLGFRSLHYIDMIPHVNWGFEMVTGSPRGGVLEGDNLTYGGISVNYDQTLATIFFIEAGALVGYGYGRIDSGHFQGSSAVLKPEVSVGIKAIDGYRASFGVGYLYLPVATGFNAFSFTIRLERRSDDDKGTAR